MAAVTDAASYLAELGFHYGHGSTTGDHQPVLLAYTPAARTNPYQALLYTRALDHGVATLPVPDWRMLGDIPWPGRLVCHFHWIANILADVQSPQEADDRIEDFASVLSHLRDEDRRIIWTAHNTLPHDTAWPDKDLELRRLLIDAADAIHVMSFGSIDALEAVVDLPRDKVIVVPHPSYVGAYPDFVSRIEARGEFGLNEADFTFLLFGALERYKGLEDLRAAFERLAQADVPRPVRLIIAGKAADDDLASELRLWSDGRDDVFVEPNKVPTEDVQYFYRASDLAVLPYREGLNSGAAMLAASFEVPILSASRQGLRDVVDAFGGSLYDPTHEDGLFLAMRSSIQTDPGSSRDQIRRNLPSVDPIRISDAFFTSALRRVGWAHVGGEGVTALAGRGLER